MVENPLGVEAEQYFLGKVPLLQTSLMTLQVPSRKFPDAIIACDIQMELGRILPVGLGIVVVQSQLPLGSGLSGHDNTSSYLGQFSSCSTDEVH